MPSSSIHNHLEYSLVTRLYYAMTLAEFSILVHADPKWVLNARALLRDSEPYSETAAERLAIIRTLHADFGIPLGRADALAEHALESGEVVRIPSLDETAVVEIDVGRIRAAIATRSSQLATMHSPRRPGRPRTAVTPVRSAKRHGLDIGLLKSNLARTPEARLRQLDAMVAFRSRVRRREAR
jgi:hypothetical protein